MQHEYRQRLMQALLLAAVAAGSAACDRIAQEPQADSGASPPAVPVPTKANPRNNPRNVMPPGGPYANREDSDTTAKVRTALKAEGAVDGEDISVSTVAGKVTLSGAVPPQQIPRALQVARAVEGVKDVDNRLLAAG